MNVCLGILESVGEYMIWVVRTVDQSRFGRKLWDGLVYLLMQIPRRIVIVMASQADQDGESEISTRADSYEELVESLGE